MNIRMLGLLAIATMASMASRAQSTIVDGIFVGTVDAGGSGMVGSLNAGTVAAGTPIFGTFSYNAQIFNVDSSNGVTEGLYYALGSASPVVITETIDGVTFTVSGNVQSQLTLDAFSPAQNPNNRFYLEAATYGASVAPGTFSGSVDLNLSNYLGAPFAASVANPGSVEFFNQSGAGVNNVDTLQALNTQGNNTGSLYFSISHAWAIPVKIAAPEIDPGSAAGGLTLLLGGMAVLRGRRSKPNASG